MTLPWLVRVPAAPRGVEFRSSIGRGPSRPVATPARLVSRPDENDQQAVPAHIAARPSGAHAPPALRRRHRATTRNTPRSVYVDGVMGTVASLDVRGHAPARETVKRCFRRLHELDAVFSTYRPGSEVSRYARGQLMRLSDDFRWVVERCAALRRETGGFFDAHATGSFDPSALVKGWAVEQAASALVDAGVENFSLTLGGDVLVRGEVAPGSAWRVGIRHPQTPRAVAAVVAVRGPMGIATSGAYERGAHIIDPLTGRTPQDVLSVTVLGRDLGTADAFATAAFAMGTDGPSWTASLAGFEALTIQADGTVLSTPGCPAT
jgi:FAD:protein FMN transferase